jgi:hypothetical protein
MRTVPSYVRFSLGRVAQHKSRPLHKAAYTERSCPELSAYVGDVFLGICFRRDRLLRGQLKGEAAGSGAEVVRDELVANLRGSRTYAVEAKITHFWTPLLEALSPSTTLAHLRFTRS